MIQRPPLVTREEEEWGASRLRVGHVSLGAPSACSFYVCSKRFCMQAVRRSDY